MKLTATLCKFSKTFGWRRLWASKRLKYPDVPPRIPKPLIEKGVEVIDPTDEGEEEIWRPPVDDPRFYVQKKNHEFCNYQEEEAFVCDPTLCIHQGIKLAACLAKAQVFEGLPVAIQGLVDSLDVHNNINLLLQRHIMQAQCWNTTKERLPKRFDSRKPGWNYPVKYGIPAKKQATILIRNLLRLCQSQVTAYPSLVDRRHIYASYINSHYFYRGQPVVVRGLVEWLITSNKPLPCFADESTVDASTQHTLPNLYPILPTIDLVPEHNYTLEHNLGMKKDWTHGQLHTVIITDNNHFKQHNRQARDIIFCLGYAVAQARQQYGEVTILPAPVCIQSVSLDHQTLNFTCFQLNTLSFESDNGIKNMVWVDGGNHLFQKILGQPWMSGLLKHDRWEDFNPDVYQKLLAVYLNGAAAVN